MIKERFIQILKEADIQVNGSRPWDIQVHDERIYRRIFLHGTLGLGESYMDGWWDCEDLAGCITRLLSIGADQTAPNFPQKLLSFSQKIFNLQNPVKAWRVGKEHYDLGNDLYEAMLDKRLVYTCAYWKDVPVTTAAGLDQAQENKLRLICEKLRLKPGQRVLDIGCGWGSFAKFAAEEYGVSVVGITVSKEQVALGMELCKGLPVELKLMDYRDLPKHYAEGKNGGKFDHIVSIGMFEHVGPKNYQVYMETARKVLKPEGLFLLHTIGGGGADPWLNKYIFPGGYLPRVEEISTAAKFSFIMEDWHNFGAYYDLTLCAWYENFEKAWPQLKASGKYTDRFYRMWRYYLLLCAAAFRVRNTQLWQIVLSPNGVPGGYQSVR